MSDNQQIGQTFDNDSNTNQQQTTINDNGQNNLQNVVENVKERNEQTHKQQRQQNRGDKEEDKQENVQQTVKEEENVEKDDKEEGVKQRQAQNEKQNQEIDIKPKVVAENSDPSIPLVQSLQFNIPRDSQTDPQIQPQTTQQQQSKQQQPQIKQQKNQSQVKQQQKPQPVHNQPTNVSPIKPPQTLQQRIDESNTMKTKGNDCYKNGDYNLAIHHYYQGLRVLDPNQLNKGTADIIQQSRNLAFSLILNIAQSHIKLGNFPQAVTCCTEVLISEPRHYKALYKRATCYFEIEKIEEALKDIKLAYEVDPTNRQGIQMYRKIGKAYEVYNKQRKQSQKQLYKNMFNPQEKSQKSTQQTTSSKKQKKISIFSIFILGSLAATGTYFFAKNTSNSFENSQKLSVVGSAISGALIGVPKVSTRVIGAVGLLAIAIYLTKKK